MSDQKKRISFKESIDLGEYKPEYLSKYPEWDAASDYIRLQYIREGMDNIHKHLKKIERDREKYFLEYSSKL